MAFAAENQVLKQFSLNSFCLPMVRFTKQDMYVAVIEPAINTEHNYF
jgi:hypothetical protein